MILKRKKKLLEIRDKRKRPQLDDKILTDWNALFIKSLINASIVLNNKFYLDSAIENIEFILIVLEYGY